MEVRVLGPLEVVDDGRDLTPARPKHRALLALLLLRANEVVPADELIEALWGHEPPGTAGKALHGHVSALRKLLGADVIETRPPGYALRMRPEETDIGRFEALVAEALQEPDPGGRSKLLRDALGLFRGEPLADFRYDAFARESAAGLEELRLSALEARVEADLELGRHAELVPELERLVLASPLRERLRGQLMVALYRAGRQSDALHVYQHGRQILADELGLDPGPAQRQLERQILAHDPALDVPAGRPPQPPPREERKVVTVLFCDLVGFTADAEELDPEDVRALQRPYFDRVRAEVGRFGGTVEKFIGDAVMAVFGAPAAHEDDPERAVRAALAVRDALTAVFEVRIGVHTGEALVTLDADPRAGEGIVAGDVVNTAARLQALAPPNGILVGETTFRATRHAIDYGPRDLVRAKGKAEPVGVYEGIGVSGAPSHVREPEFVGRSRELHRLVAAFERASAERQPELVTIAGVPGIGKTRLLREFRGSVGERATWYQGRSLPYGDGVTYWALGEVVKACAGVLESDEPADVAAKIERAADQAVTDPAEARWVARQLGPLVGLEAEGSTAAGEAWAAWRVFFEGLAERGPTVLALEDLHWADTGLLDFVDELVDHAADVPLVMVCTARPELLDRRPGWGGGKRNTTTVSLAPLSREETAQLVGALLRGRELPQGAQARVLERADGNPLYAREFAHLALERGVAAEVDTPESLHALIAGRLDALAPPEKQLVQDASVVGEVLWVDALAAIAGRPVAAVDELLHALERKEFLRRHRRSSVEGQSEYAFHHVLVRDVAYSQIPRSERAGKHRQAAEWIEALGRREDHAEMLAHHYVRALDLARAAHEPSALLEERARVALRDAGDRAAGLGVVSVAAAYYTRALELWPEDDPDRLRILLAQTRQHSELQHDVERWGSEALAAALRAGERVAAAEVEVMLGDSARVRGSAEGPAEHFERALELVEDEPTTASKAFVLERVGWNHLFSGNPARAKEFADAVLTISEEVGRHDLRADVLNLRGSSRRALGDPGGVVDIEAAVEAAAASGSPIVEMDALGNLGVFYLDLGQLQRGYAAIRRERELAERLRVPRLLVWTAAGIAEEHYLLGRWDDAVEVADEALGAASSVRYAAALRYTRGLVRLGRGDLTEAHADAAYPLSTALPGPDRVHALAFAARVALERERPDEAAALVDEALNIFASLPGSPPFGLIDLEIVSSKLGRVAEMRPILERVPSAPWYEAIRASARGDHRGAAGIYADIGALSEEAFARLRAGEALAAEGRLPDAEAQLAKALAFYRPVRASAYIGRAEAALAQSARA
jgi:DNA-binding SARP family transcriptional activator/tetratricopeptide (TPR) repeat protein